MNPIPSGVEICDNSADNLRPVSGSLFVSNIRFRIWNFKGGNRIFVRSNTTEMKTYSLPLVPGPVSVPDDILKLGLTNYGSADMEEEYSALYGDTEVLLRELMGTRNRIVIHTGEGMIALWSAMKSTLAPGDRVLALSTGLFGYGMGTMAESAGCEVMTVGFDYDDDISDLDRVEEAIRSFRPKMITMVENETPSGIRNNVEAIGRLKTKYGVHLLYVDAVSGIGGDLIRTDDWNVDLCLGGSQKCISAPPHTAFFSVSDKAWEIAEKVNYAGYDAFLPFRTAPEDGNFPYTPYWQGLAQLHGACLRIKEEGMETVRKRHRETAMFVRKRIREMGLRLFPRREEIMSDTVTAVYVPDAWSWKDLDKALRLRGLVLGGNYGCLSGKVFRIGHMGTQADMELVKKAMDILEETVNK